jgi:hypothetical protein
VKEGSPARPGSVHNGSVTRRRAGVPEAVPRSTRSLVFPLTAAPSPAAATTCRRRHEQRTSHFGRRTAHAVRPVRTGSGSVAGRADRPPRPRRRTPGGPASPLAAFGGLPVGCLPFGGLPVRRSPRRSPAVRPARPDGSFRAGDDPHSRGRPGPGRGRSRAGPDRREPAARAGPPGGALGRRPAGRVPGLALLRAAGAGADRRRPSRGAARAGPPGGALGRRPAGRVPGLACPPGPPAGRRAPRGAA